MAGHQNSKQVMLKIRVTIEQSRITGQSQTVFRHAYCSQQFTYCYWKQLKVSRAPWFSQVWCTEYNAQTVISSFLKYFKEIWKLCSLSPFMRITAISRLMTIYLCHPILSHFLNDIDHHKASFLSQHDCCSHYSVCNFIRIFRNERQPDRAIFGTVQAQATLVRFLKRSNWPLDGLNEGTRTQSSRWKYHTALVHHK